MSKRSASTHRSQRYARTFVACMALFSLVSAYPAPAADSVDYDRDIRPLLSSRCLKCHGADEPKANLNLTSRTSTVDSGAVTPHNSANSTLLERVTSNDPEVRMPPTGDPLSVQEIQQLQRWIEAGADWPQHWAYRELQRPAVPVATTPEIRHWCQTPIDQFIAAKLTDNGLIPSPQADRLTLLRRVSFDLLGLPPTSLEIEQFLHDDAPDAWSRCVDRLLASPAYGERWARHWMDLVHFAETHGHDQDRPREHAWPYRDYLIQSLNADKPYPQFVVEQIAGDVISPQDSGAIAATGLLAAGPWDESSLRDIREDSIDREIGRYLDRDDIVTTVMSTFASTSVQCARCHDHKFDPITQQEYYGLQAVFAGIDKANRPYDADPATGLQRAQLQRAQQEFEASAASHPAKLLTESNQQQLAVWEQTQAEQQVLWRKVQLTSQVAQGGATLQQLDDGSLLAEGPRPERDQYVVQGTISIGRVTALRLDLLTHDSLPLQGPGRAENGNLHLNELRVFHILDASTGTERELNLQTPQADFNQAGWGIDAALDRNPNTAWGIHPEVGKSHYGIFTLQQPLNSAEPVTLRFELAQVHGGGHLIGRFLLSTTDAEPTMLTQSLPIPFDIAEVLHLESDQRSVEQQSQLMIWFQRRELERALAALPAQQLVYCGTNQFATEGSFRPTTVPREIQVLHRGLVQQPQGAAIPGGLSCIDGLPGDFELQDFANEGARRQALANWLVDERNPLLWRSIVNRVWQAHFGRALVSTPNDFGQMGAVPTHPELLDWLAVTLREQGGSLKGLHRLILSSAVYQQVSQQRSEAVLIDADNQWLWRMHRQRRDAEAFRDALLVAAGNLDSTMGGPSVRQFLQSPGVHVTPVVDYQNFQADDPANRRRSVYRFLFRTVPDPFMEALDCPDASQLTPTRNVSLTALQALATLNDKFVIYQCQVLADSLQADFSELPAQVDGAYQRLLSRGPTDEERAVVVEYATQYGLANACRMLCNTNEFLFVE